MRNSKEENELLFTRKILCAMVEQAVFDVRESPTYSRKYKNQKAQMIKDEAIYFIKSRPFTDICNALNLPVDRIKRVAFT
jgi:hypothetical protein